MTGDCHHGSTAEKSRGVCRRLGLKLQMSQRDTELTGLLALVAVVIVAEAGLPVA